jgi:hypothetical protein
MEHAVLFVAIDLMAGKPAAGNQPPAQCRVGGLQFGARPFAARRADRHHVDMGAVLARRGDEIVANAGKGEAGIADGDIEHAAIGKNPLRRAFDLE